MTKSKASKRKQAFLAKRLKGRNDSWFDIWSIVHILTGILLGMVMPPFIAVSIMILWEPLEIFVISPLLAKIDIFFGYETMRNSFSDIVFDIIGVALGYYVFLSFVAAPSIHLL